MLITLGKIDKFSNIENMQTLITKSKSVTLQKMYITKL